MTNISELRSGDTVRNIGTGEAYVVTFTDGKTTVGVRTLTITNPDEWELVSISELTGATYESETI